MQCNHQTFLCICTWCLVPKHKQKKLKLRLQAAQNICIRFCSKLNDRSSIKSRNFEKINWLPIYERVSQCSLCSVYKFVTKNCRNYFNEIYVSLEINGIHMRSSYQKPNIPHRKTNIREKAWSYFGPSLWSNLDKTLKTSTSISAFKHNIKQHYFNELKKKQS